MARTKPAAKTTDPNELKPYKVKHGCVIVPNPEAQEQNQLYLAGKVPFPPEKLMLRKRVGDIVMLNAADAASLKARDVIEAHKGDDDVAMTHTPTVDGPRMDNYLKRPRRIGSEEATERLLAADSQIPTGTY